ncbi:hypothetical protein TNCT_2971 [Trichonephila clavata]|uniref:Uncharacterized protein n=1 Tax=Trichonephila clavata TaxID=2740835 RepID=A0A8X6L4N7_TRICU|nr:hypothetical protein TNCT_2971 [Trichonephila clavata]
MKKGPTNESEKSLYTWDPKKLISKVKMPPTSSSDKGAIPKLQKVDVKGSHTIKESNSLGRETEKRRIVPGIDYSSLYVPPKVGNSRSVAVTNQIKPKNGKHFQYNFKSSILQAFI